MEDNNKKIEKLNCWEVKKCSREPGGAKAHELGICPAATENKVNGIHGGKNGGRCCWVVAGTFCKGIVQGSFAQKYENCQKCEFYQEVIKESSKDSTLEITSAILKILRDKK
jgi:hypothetical protein